MSESTKKIYYRRSGATYSVKTYTTIAEVWPDYLTIYLGAPYYAQLGAVSDPAASYLRAYKNGTKAVLNQRLSNQWLWAVRTGATSVPSSNPDNSAVAVDSSGNCYVTGNFTGTITLGATQLVSSGSSDIFIAKLNSSGAWQWAVKAGGTGTDFGCGISVDSSGNCYVTGQFYGTATFGATQLTSGGYNDIFIAKLNTSGAWQWAVKAGGTSYDLGIDIATDSSGNCYVTGEFYGTATFGATQLTASAGIFIAKLNSSGAWQWAVAATGSNTKSGIDIGVDTSGNCYVTGIFYGTATFGTTYLTATAQSDIFVAKLNTSGAWQWAVQAGSSGLDAGRGIGVDSSGNCYVSGFFQGTATFGATQLTSDGGYDIFIAKLNTSGVWQWVVQAGGTGDDKGIGIYTDSSGNCYVTGQFYGTATFGTTQLTASGINANIFVAKLNTSGAWQWATQAGGTSIDVGYEIAVDSGGSCYVTGFFQGTATFGATQLTASGSETFVAKIG